MREELADGDFSGARQIGKILGHAVVERQLALLLKQQQRRRGELFRDRTHGIAGVDIGGPFGGQIGGAEGFGVEEFSVFHDGHGDARRAGFGERRGNFLVELLIEIDGRLGPQRGRG